MALTLPAAFVVVIILNSLTFTSFVLPKTHLFIDNSLTALQISQHLSRPTMYG